jgi:deoxyribonuclease II
MRIPIRIAALVALIIFSISEIRIGYAADAPAPLLKQGQPVDWWFAFKFNTKAFPGCDGGTTPQCTFGGGEPGKYVSANQFSQQYVFASNANRSLAKGGGCIGTTTDDPVGATFDQSYNGDYHYVVWNDQFYLHPKINGCGASCSGPWGHSKGMVVWDDDGNGYALQVTTPSWPGAGSKKFPRASDGNTLGCVQDNNVKVSQHFFALRLTKDDLIKVLKALQNASVVTDVRNEQLVNNGGPSDVQELVKTLGVKSDSEEITKDELSTGVILVSKPSALNVPPWQMLSAVLDGTPLRSATWWASPQIYSSTASTKISCWDDSLRKPGAVAIATTGQWEQQMFGLTGGPSTNNNHAKIGVSTSGDHFYAIFGDLNQQGTLSGSNCASSQNGRGGLFYIVDDRTLHDAVENLIKGDTAPTRAPAN